RGAVPLGNVQAFIQYVNRFSQPVRQVAQLANNIQITIASCERVFEVLDEPEMEEIHSNVEVKEESPYAVELEHVQFKYSDMEELLMTDFNLQVEPGEMIAVVGPTGLVNQLLLTCWSDFMMLMAEVFVITVRTFEISIEKN